MKGLQDQIRGYSAINQAKSPFLFSRKNLCQMLHDLLVLPEVPESLMGVLHARYMDIQPEENNRIQELVEIIADVRQPMVMIETAQNKEEKRQWELKVVP